MHETGFYSIDDHRTLRHFFADDLAAYAAEFFDPRLPVFDLGCGRGAYCAYLAERGFTVTGFEGAADMASVSVHGDIRTQNLAHPFAAGTAQVLCLEVGEHIPEKYEQTFLDNLARIASHKAIISWAVPGQPGNGHVNCRPNDYVIAELEKRGLVWDRESTARIRCLNFGDATYFSNTLLVFHAPDKDSHAAG